MSILRYLKGSKSRWQWCARKIFWPCFVVALPFKDERRPPFGDSKTDSRFGLAGAVWDKRMWAEPIRRRSGKSRTFWINSYKSNQCCLSPFGVYGATVGMGGHPVLIALREYSEVKKWWWVETARTPFANIWL